jgi:dipeptidyl aminopeptidase/acylaminoacyl peptidase
LLFTLAARTQASPQQAAEKKPAARRTLTIDDAFQIKRVGDPQISPDDKWVAYTVSTTSLKDERSETQIWMAPLSGGEAIPLTAKGVSSSSPRWSPDGKYLAFISSRSVGPPAPGAPAAGDGPRAQVWLLDRRGGEAQQLTEVRQGVGGFEWSPDSTRLVLTIRDPRPEEAGEQPQPRPRTQPPWVIDRLQFKQDVIGYLDRRRTHLYVFDVASKKLTQITSGDYEDGGAAWSPDGKLIAFVSNRTAEPDSNFNSDIWLVAADNTDKGQTLVQLTTNPGPDRQAAWSPDGKSVAYVTATDVKNFWYATNYLAVVGVPDAAGKIPAAQIVTQKLDRNVGNPEFAPDGKSIYFVLEDQGERHLAQIALGSNSITRPVAGARSVGAFALAKNGAVAVRISESSVPGEIFVSEGGALRRLTRANDALMAQLDLSAPEKIKFKSKDGTPIEGYLFKPIGYQPGLRYPTLLRIHGGPVAQYEASFNFESQLFAANGYAVLNINPRGSSGYGQAFSQAIFADWGNKDYEDVMAGVDYAIAQGIADPERLGVGGWSYGGMLTNYTITQTTRFKAAISGASVGLVSALYGHDHYQRHYEVELGLPWQNRAVWDRVSPFWKVEKITTPTLWICGERDWNVPVINSEQMYQGMKRLGRTTQLVVYPGEFHGIQRPSYQKDRFERYLAWYGQYVKGEKPAEKKEIKAAE